MKKYENLYKDFCLWWENQKRQIQIDFGYANVVYDEGDRIVCASPISYPQFIYRYKKYGKFWLNV